MEPAEVRHPAQDIDRFVRFDEFQSTVKGTLAALLTELEESQICLSSKEAQASKQSTRTLKAVRDSFHELLTCMVIVFSSRGNLDSSIRSSSV